METTTKALILKKVPYSGSSYIVQTYTREKGVIPFLVRGIGKKKGNNRSLIEPLSFVEISFHFREKYEVQTAKSISNDFPTGGLFFDPIKSTVQLFLAEILVKALREETADEDLFDYLYSSISLFREDENQRDFHLIFLLKLTRFLGFFPNGKKSSSTPYFDLQNGEFCSHRTQSLHTLDLIESDDLSAVMIAEYGSPLSFNQERKRKALDFLVEYYRLHLEGFGELKSLGVLKEVFA
ncbi:MAG: DNA repair protein RecO [Bacteroidota bacterium]